MTLSRKAAIILGALFFASLALNLFFGGLAVGRGLAHGARPFQPDFNMARMMRALPDQARDSLRQAIREHRPRIGERRRALKEAGRDLPAILRGDPFDAEAARKTFREQRTRHMELQEVIQEAMIAAMSRLSAEERRAFMEFQGRNHRGFRGRDGHGPMRRHEGPPGETPPLDSE